MIVRARKALATVFRPAAARIFLSAVAAVAGVAVYLEGSRPPAVIILCFVVFAASLGGIVAEIIRVRTKKVPDDMISRAMAASERRAELGSVAAAVAHEIRNPLGALDIHAQLLEENLPRDGSNAAEARNHLDIIRSETHRLNLIVENFIRFARHKPLDLQPVRMADHLADVMRLIRSEAGERRIVIDHACLRTDLPTVVADPNQLEQAFLNVVLNALQSMPDGGRLTLSSQMAGGYVECSISNTGPQIPPEICESIFDLYYTTKEDGSGLGLPIAQKILGDHNGYITVRSELEQTSFFIGIPATVDA